MPIINNITRMLDSKKIHYTAFELPVEKLSAIETAHLLGVDPKLVYKSIVVKRLKGKMVLAIIPGTNHLDLKLLAGELGEKKLILPTEREAEELTGLQAGGISPLALLHKGFQMVIDVAAQNNPEIHLSGGQRGLSIRLPVKSILELTRARFAVISVLNPENS